MNKIDFDSDYEQFLKSDSIESVLQHQHVEKFKSHIKKDLVKSTKQMIIFYLLVSLLGYLVSLSICAQNGFGLFHFSHSVLSSLHSLPGLLCPIICGSIFTGVPFLISLIFLNRFQHRYLLFKLWWLIAIVPILATSFMSFLPTYVQHNLFEMMNHDLLITKKMWLTAWATSAVLLPYLLEFLMYIYLFLKKNKS